MLSFRITFFFFLIPLVIFCYSYSFPGGSYDESICSMGDLGLIPGLGRFPAGGPGSPWRFSCLENLHGQRSQTGYSPWGYKESETTWVTKHILGAARSAELLSSSRKYLCYNMKDLIHVNFLWLKGKREKLLDEQDEYTSYHRDSTV